ncbi:MAG: sigma-54-dependent Fis family transcriptional regulator [Deltaproteobacteria bacterium]|nr:sigma-54-dependent Fis family transcriptional regulator [Deltaproteobacteria bacterium]
MNRLNIIIVEDESPQRKMLGDFLNNEGHGTVEAEDGEKAINLIRTMPLDLAIIDYRMPGATGLEVLREAKALNPELDIIIITAYGTIETAVEAMKAGAVDYITKPIDLEELLLVINRIASHRILLRENEILRQRLNEKSLSQERIIYKSIKMAKTINLAARVAESHASVLIQGESGTGKELLAGLIHSLSPRKNNALIVVNCAALPESILESELFGHEKGAFTGAMHKRIGRFEQAHKGTLFLDEIGELSLQVQVKLLRFLQDGEFQPVGGNQVFKADVRIISATNRDLKTCVKDGIFRDDLFFRLNVVEIEIPSLRERREDISLLIDFFIERYSKENAKAVRGISRESRDLLLKYDYPGNVRELENIIERAVVISRGPVISLTDLPFSGREDIFSADLMGEGGTLKETLEKIERSLVEQAMKDADNIQTRAAEALGLSERMLRYKLKKYGLK